MSRLAQRGHRVLYVDPQLGISGWLKWFLRGRVGLRDLFLWSRKASPNLTIFSLVFMPPRYRWGRRINDFVRREGARVLSKKLGMRDPLLWIYHPDGVSFVGRMREQMVAYDCVDEYSSFPAYSSKNRRREIISNEQKLLRKASVVFTTSKPLQEAKKGFNSNTYLVHNVADVSHFSRAYFEELSVPDDLTKISKPIIGFVGSLDDYKVDFDLLDYLAKARPEWSIVLVGPVGEGDRSTSVDQLRTYRNVYFLGLKPYSDLPNYLRAFDACIIPYRLNEYNRYSFPLKVFEFLASGKPVVATDLPSLHEQRDVLRIASSPEEFIEQISEALAENSRLAKKRVEVAKTNTWDHRVDQLLSIVSRHLSGKNRAEGRC
jgi:glycosyltransferase involved in cell wall biosynthesis